MWESRGRTSEAAGGVWGGCWGWRGHWSSGPSSSWATYVLQTFNVSFFPSSPLLHVAMSHILFTHTQSALSLSPSSLSSLSSLPPSLPPSRSQSGSIHQKVLPHSEVGLRIVQSGEPHNTRKFCRVSETQLSYIVPL